MKGLNKDTKMKATDSKALTIALLWCCGALFFGCQKNAVVRNPYLPEMQFNAPVDLNLPQFDNLRYAGGAVLLPQYGHKGVIVFNLSGNAFLAWEASCPNHLPRSCSQTRIVGVLAECSCESFQYSLATGQLLNATEEQTQIYSLVNYRVENLGNRLLISN